MSGGVGVSGVYWGTGREYRYSGARSGIGSIRGDLGSPRECKGCSEPLGGCQGVSGVYWDACREFRYSEARRGIGGLREHWGSLGV